MKAFKSILAFQKHFDTEEKCREYLDKQTNPLHLHANNSKVYNVYLMFITKDYL